ncbi:hypothetical protein ASD64_05850 [Mesorhizobium sp. Root157]|uniref:hypothetical protein n=1 Tax=Mesorhizobium sp. Root157 TaxID=1736477 RepID=UPI0006FF666C|nr:hypothetical protein [Mesorhizobium sp. Root157]KQZ86982.1 hypothetical protein ASD64_05850 [Mesorhizobium sp. Root157]
MIKFIVATLWICAVTVGAVFYSFQAAGARDEAATAKPLFGGLDYVSTDIITVPYVRNARVDGYFLTKLVFTAEPAKLAKLSVPPTSIITDQVYSYLYSNPQIDFSDKTTIDLDAFRTSLRDSINTRVGIDLIKEVLVDQIDFLTKDDIRDNAKRRRKPSTPANSQTEPTSTH